MRLWRPSTEFTDRMRDMKLVFMNADSLETHRETGLPVNSKSGLSPYVLQLAHMHKPAPDTWDIEAGWAYKRLFERRNYRLKQTGTTWTFEDKGKVDGNYSPTDPAKP